MPELALDRQMGGQGWWLLGRDPRVGEAPSSLPEPLFLPTAPCYTAPDGGVLSPEKK